MSSGSKYIQAPYDAVSAQSVSTFANTIPSGASIVRGIYYMWNDGGFTGYGWKSDIEGSPIQMAISTGEIPTAGYTTDEEAAAAYVASEGNLNKVFDYWSRYYTLEGWHNFYTAVGVDSGCMDVDHSQG